MKPETELRNLRRDVKRLSQEAFIEKQRANAASDRALRAEKSEAEWRRRFDTLLNKCGIQGPAEGAA